MSDVLQIALVQTGGTIEKTYNAWGGTLANAGSVLEDMLNGLQLEGVQVQLHPLLAKDSLDLTPGDHDLIVKRALELAGDHDGVVVLHGTDRLSVTGEQLHTACGGAPEAPIVLTGAMRPWILRTSDALQNLTEALLAVQLLPRGVHVCMHNRVLTFPGVVKDTAHLRFVSADETQEELDA
ncbi:MAG: asparaginase [Phycisphaerales bacterium]|nr:asparaginase [Phycisphaerales bacterium]